MPSFVPLQTEVRRDIKEEWGEFLQSRKDGGGDTAFSRESTSALSGVEADEEMDGAMEEEEVESGSLTPTGPTPNDVSAALLASLVIPFHPFEGIKAPSVSPSPSLYHGQSTRSASRASRSSVNSGESRSASVFNMEDEDVKPIISIHSSRASSTLSTDSYLSSSSSTLESSTSASTTDIEDLKPDIKPKLEFLVPTLPARKPKSQSKSKTRDPIKHAQRRVERSIRKARDYAPSPSPSIQYVRMEEKEVTRIVEEEVQEEEEESDDSSEDLKPSYIHQREVEIEGGEIPKGDFTTIRGEKEAFSESDTGGLTTEGETEVETTDESGDVTESCDERTVRASSTEDDEEFEEEEEDLPYRRVKSEAKGKGKEREAQGGRSFITKGQRKRKAKETVAPLYVEGDPRAGRSFDPTQYPSSSTFKSRFISNFQVPTWSKAPSVPPRPTPTESTTSPSPPQSSVEPPSESEYSSSSWASTVDDLPDYEDVAEEEPVTKKQKVVELRAGDLDLDAHKDVWKPTKETTMNLYCVSLSPPRDTNGYVTTFPMEDAYSLIQLNADIDLLASYKIGPPKAATFLFRRDRLWDRGTKGYEALTQRPFGPATSHECSSSRRLRLVSILDRSKDRFIPSWQPPKEERITFEKWIEDVGREDGVTMANLRDAMRVGFLPIFSTVLLDWRMTEPVVWSRKRDLEQVFVEGGYDRVLVETLMGMGMGGEGGLVTSDDEDDKAEERLLDEFIGMLHDRLCWTWQRHLVLLAKIHNCYAALASIDVRDAIQVKINHLVTEANEELEKYEVKFKTALRDEKPRDIIDAREEINYLIKAIDGTHFSSHSSHPISKLRAVQNRLYRISSSVE